MPDHTKPNPPRPVLTATEAQLFVADVAASCAFYKDKLGFAVEFMYGDPPFYALVFVTAPASRCVACKGQSSSLEYATPKASFPLRSLSLPQQKQNSSTKPAKPPGPKCNSR